MSQQSSPFASQPVFVTPAPEPPGSNPLGIAGFVCSLLGLLASCCTCSMPIVGLLSLTGLVLSFVAVFRRPRGMAIAGLIMGIIASILSLIGVVTWVTLSAAGGIMQVGKAAMIAEQAEQQLSNGSYPSDLSFVTGQLPPWFIKDSWGNTLVYEAAPDGSVYTVRSMGPDGQDGTTDDVTFEEFIEEPGYVKVLPEGTIPEPTEGPA